MITAEINKKSFWALPASEALSLLETSEDGLSGQEALARLSVFGPNSLETRAPLTRFKLFAQQFQSPLIFILLIAGVITFSVKDYHDTIFILATALANAWLGFYQEHKAQAALEHLKNYITYRVRVFRDNSEIELETTHLVPGDVIRLSQGDVVPADARLLFANDFFVDQAILTGEALPVQKGVRPTALATPLADRNSMVFSGTTVIQGVARAVVTATDRQTELGKIAELVLRPEEEQTPLQKALARFAFHIGIFIAFMAVAVFVVAQFSGLPFLQSFLIAVAIVVASVPEGLPIVMTVILAIGVQRLAKDNGVVRRLSAAETLGSTSVILTDKTVTLTQAKMTLARLKGFHTREMVFSNEVLLRLALLNVDVIIENPNDAPALWQIDGKPLEVALVRAAADQDILLSVLRAEKNTVHFFPFSSKNKYSAALCEISATQFGFGATPRRAHILTLLGAPEVLLQFCHEATDREHILKAVAAMADSGERVVGVAVKEIQAAHALDLKMPDHLRDLIFAGTLSFRDPLRPGVKDALAEVTAAGVRTIIVTGDHRGTAISVARELGMQILDINILDGNEVDAISETELKHRLPHLKVVSRVSPEGKLRIVRAFQELNEVVAMNGDGINDAPSLKEADIGIAMGTGSDIAKDVSDLILLDDNFETIVDAIKQGRQILENIRKAVVYLSSTILDEVLLIGSSLLIGLPLPFSPLQILWVNFFTDSFPGIALSFEDKIDSFAARPKTLSRGLFTNEMKFLVFVNGVISSVLLVVMYVSLLNHGFRPEVVRTFIFGAFGTYSLFLIFAVRSLKKGILHYNPFSNLPIVLAVLLGFSLTMIAIYVPFFQKLFGTVPLTSGWLLGLVGFGILNVILVEFGKWLFHRTAD